MPLSSFALLEREFLRLTGDGIAKPLALDGEAVGHGLPARAIPLDELRELLLHPGTAFETRDAAVRALLQRARAHGGDELVGLTGLLLPGLRRAARAVRATCPYPLEDLENEMFTAFLAAVGKARLDASRLAGSLVWAAKRAGYHLLGEHADRRRRGDVSGLPDRADAGLDGHPDLVLRRAVGAGVLRPRDADLIGDTRLGGLSVQALADRANLPYETVRKRRQRAEALLVAWLAATGTGDDAARNTGTTAWHAVAHRTATAHRVLAPARRRAGPGLRATAGGPGRPGRRTCHRMHVGLASRRRRR